MAHGLNGAHHTYGGDERGLEVVDNWSAKGKKYDGSAELRAKWKSLAAMQALR
ncbi:MAG: PriCT-2 domain-containing protein [Gammaproteobacteria bacterium]|nr:PriCT-2 domain-containing protein [Gammaproteobacteria bacterium]